MLQLDFWAMGCWMRAMTEGEGPEQRRALEAVPGWFESWEARLSRFRPGSELNELNARSGAWFRVSALLYQQIELALQMAKDTGGLVDPTVLPALAAAGYDRPFVEMAERGGFNRATDPSPAGWWGAVELDPDRQAIRIPPGAQIDLGGVSKGWSAEEAAARLAVHGPALVDAGGDIAVRGPRQDGAAWPIDVADPHGSKQEILGRLWIEDGFVATSGRDLRHWDTANGRQHHLIDPRSGMPSGTDLLAVTILAPTAQRGEAAAKAAFLQGSEEGHLWLESSADLEGLLVTEKGSLLTTRGLGRYGWRQ